ncbi:hypothetical protein OKW43_003833 [Paraburkholderia sp. WC7.3g]
MEQRIVWRLNRVAIDGAARFAVSAHSAWRSRCVPASAAAASGPHLARVASAGLKIVPIVGHVAAAPTDACADVIDP